MYESSSSTSSSGVCGRGGGGVGGADETLSHGPRARGVNWVNGELLDISVMAGIMCDGVWGCSTIHPTVPGDPEDQQY